MKIFIKTRIRVELNAIDIRAALESDARPISVQAKVIDYYRKFFSSDPYQSQMRAVNAGGDFVEHARILYQVEDC
jgi:hypothetical protein